MAAQMNSPQDLIFVQAHPGRPAQDYRQADGDGDHIHQPIPADRQSADPEQDGINVENDVSQGM